MPPCDTKNRILDCAETMFSKNGYNNTSMRLLAEVAGVNVASTNYHFGSKDKLLQAVVERRILPLNQIRKERIHAVLERAKRQKERPSVHNLLTAFLDPTFEFRNSSDNARAFIGLVSRSLSEPDTAVRSCFLELIKPNFQELFTALQLALPHLPEDILKARLQLSIGTMSYALSMNISAEFTDRGMMLAENNPTLIPQLKNYILAGLEAPL